ncbi:MAG: hypothetical protein H6662_10565 [Ardenticatenaceae bacterium]|nr:hypothetical protein [Anaerolineales bacterium]MCB8922017.1 hypothetical protein [Ardenticatenaceae bacterium]MCB8989593.1 hypothetical protein [Ardenticatenaceae bacterium]MCB9003136.1 hypothetical protein [Ardenticatenaceae bacterium]
MKLDEFSRTYLTLTLEIDKHIDGYIDAYTGPADLKTAVSATPKREPTALLDDLAWLQANIPTEDVARADYVTAVLTALQCTLHLLRGDDVPYLDEVQRLYDIRPSLVDEAEFSAAHNELDTLLPGSAPLPDRLDTHRKQYYLPQEKVLPMLELAREEARRRTLSLLDLPADNGVDITLTSSQPWSAYNWFKGDGRSHIEFNTDNPISALGLISTFAHEGYPGHHTEHLLKEQKFVHELGYGEMAAALLHSPSAVIAEGIATTAVEIIFPDHSHHQWTLDVLLPAAGLTAIDTAETLRRLARAQRMTRYVNGNAAILYHTGQLSKEQTIEYIQTYGLSTPQRAAHSFSFISHPLFRSYLFTYTYGYDLIVQAAPDGNKWPIFRRLLVEQIRPSQLKV